MNKKTIKQLKGAKAFCEFLASLNINEKALKNNMLTTVKGLEMALAVAESLENAKK